MYFYFLTVLADEKILDKKIYPETDPKPKFRKKKRTRRIKEKFFKFIDRSVWKNEFSHFWMGAGPGFSYKPTRPDFPEQLAWKFQNFEIGCKISKKKSVSYGLSVP